MLSFVVFLVQKLLHHSVEEHFSFPSEPSSHWFSYSDGVISQPFLLFLVWGLNMREQLRRTYLFSAFSTISNHCLWISIFHCKYFLLWSLFSWRLIKEIKFEDDISIVGFDNRRKSFLVIGIHLYTTWKIGFFNFIIFKVSIPDTLSFNFCLRIPIDLYNSFAGWFYLLFFLDRLQSQLILIW